MIHYYRIGALIRQPITCLLCLFLLFLSFAKGYGSSKDQQHRDSRIEHARDLLQTALDDLVRSSKSQESFELHLSINPVSQHLPEEYRRTEGFTIIVQNRKIDIIGFDAGGVLYGCLTMKDRVEREQMVPADYRFSDAPDMKLRGTCILLMKLGTYNFTVSPQEFPFFYDKDLWLSYLDFLLENRFNYVAFWNGHPFDYFVKLEKFPEAQKGMPPGLLARNHDMLRWLCEEGEKRNIRFLFQFYNIHTSVYFQEAHDQPPEISTPTPLLADYTAHCIERFLLEFPQVGLYITPGEALDLTYTDLWINEVILPAIKRSGKTPPVFVRAWGIDLAHARKVDKSYPDLFWERKFNVEMIADTRPDPENKAWAALNGNFIVNIHCVANLEPFRWNPQEYIQKIIKNSLQDGANGLHLYPRKAWRWPYGSDTGVKELQWERDALWFQVWGRYAWRADRNQAAEKAYWLQNLVTRFGTARAAEHFYNSFQAAADILPGLQRLIWLGYDNHTVVAAGIKLTQLETARGIPFLSQIGSMRIPDYLQFLKDAKTPDQTGPIDFLAEKIAEAELAVLEAQKGVNLATKNQEEGSRILSDASAVLLLTNFYYHKMRAVVFKMLYENNVYIDKNKAAFIENLEASLDDYRALTGLTKLTYESITDVPAKHPEKLKACPYHWSDILPLFEKELEIYRQEVAQPLDSTYFLPSLPGLAGIWYGDPDLMNADHPFTATALKYNWDQQTEELGKNWSAHWFGYISFPVSGKVEFSVLSDRGVIIKIDQTELIAWEGYRDERNADFAAEKGRWYSFELIYNHPGGNEGSLHIQWQLPGFNQSEIPVDYLCHSLQQKRMIAKEKKLLSGEENEK